MCPCEVCRHYDFCMRSLVKHQVLPNICCYIEVASVTEEE